MSESVDQCPRKLGLLELLRMADRNAELLTAPSRAVVMDQRWHVKLLGEVDIPPQVVARTSGLG